MLSIGYRICSDEMIEEREIQNKKMSRRRRDKKHESVTCSRVTNHLAEPEKYQHKVLISPAELNYQGQNLKVDTEQIDLVRILTSGEYGDLFIADIKGEANVQITIQKISLAVRTTDEYDCPVDLSTLESLSSKTCPYILSYYGAVLDKSRTILTLCMAPMDASMENFCTTLHSMDNLTNVIEWKHLFCRLINHVASAFNFLTNNGIDHRFLKPSTILVNRQGSFKLCDVCVTNEERFLEVYPRPSLYYYGASVPIMEETGCNIHPGMWIFGLNLFEILTGQYPFSGLYPIAFVTLIQTWSPTFPSNEINLEEIEQLIIRLLKTDKQQQPQNFIEILDIPCIKAVTEQASTNELDFIARIIDRIPTDSD